MLRGFQSCDSAPEGRQGITQVSATRLNTSAFLPDVEEAKHLIRCGVLCSDTAPMEKGSTRRVKLRESRQYTMRHDDRRSTGDSGKEDHARGCGAGGKLSSYGVGIRGNPAAFDFIMRRWRSSQMLLEIFQIS